MEISPNKIKTLPWVCLGIGVFLLGWEVLSRLYGSALIFPGPLPVLGSFARLVQSRFFLEALGESFLRVLLGIALALPLGLIIGGAAGLDQRLHAFFKPLFTVISATPIISLILMAFLILGSGTTPVFTAFLMVFPVISANTIEGIKSTDPHLLELFKAYRMSRRETINYLYLPTLLPFILGGLRSSLSLCWKVVVAAEVIVQPAISLGTGMQRARASLETAELFAWTAATVLAAALCQGLLSLALRRSRLFSLPRVKPSPLEGA